ncbi:MAG: hypothetical protein HFJ99_00315 [Eubacterium sp.]|nr:hypothetical protein [Eubacterium sp.]
MKFLKKLSNAIHARAASYVYFVLSVCAFVFLRSAVWTYGWIAELYPLGDKFVPTLLGIIALCIAVTLIYLIISAFLDDGKEKCKGIIFLNIIHTVFSLLGIITFLYTSVLLFSMDSGITSAGFAKGFDALAPNLVYIALSFGLGLVFVFCGKTKKTWRAVVSVLIVCCLMLSLAYMGQKSGFIQQNGAVVPITMQSENLAEGAAVVFESLKKGEKADAENLLSDNNECWTPQAPNRMPAEGYADANNSYVEIELSEKSEINTAVIEEVGNQAQYFRLQALVDDEWITVYQSEKIQSLRLCSFDTVMTDHIRLSIDKFRNEDTSVKIKSLKLYNEPVRSAEDFEVTAYQRLDGDVPTEILAQGEDYVKNYARFYDVYSTVIVFAAVHWDENGRMDFGNISEEEFAEQVDALKQIISYRSNPDHKVKLIFTVLADGAWNDQGGVNVFMTKYWESVADQIVEFAAKYELDGVDIDWEYPRTPSDWKIFESFIEKLDTDLNKVKEDTVISAALSAGQLGMTTETLERIDQIQFMAYDGNDVDGYQSSLQQAQEGLNDFIKNGADIKKINIGIAAYGRPINNTPYWATWRDLQEANYWNNKYYTVADGNQIYEGTFCFPALAGDKTAYALFSGAGGVMVFRVACDKTMDDPNSVACGIENTLKRYVQNW